MALAILGFYNEWTVPGMLPKLDGPMVEVFASSRKRKNEK
jgi:hypothetical protein